MSQPTTSRLLLAGIATGIVIVAPVLLFIPSMRIVGSVLLVGYFCLIAIVFQFSLYGEIARQIAPRHRWMLWIPGGVLWAAFFARSPEKGDGRPYDPRP